MNRIAVIDLGTSSANLLIFEINGANRLDSKLIFKDKAQPRLGQGMQQNGNCISRDAIEATLVALKKHQDQAKKYGVEQLKVVATEALRKAVNSAEVIEVIDKKLGLTIDILSQKKEAQVFWHGATMDFEWDGYIAAIDIGGGSVEFMYGKKDKLLGFYPFKMGALFLREKFAKGDPIKPEEFKAIEDYIKNEIKCIDIELPSDTPYIHGSSSVIDFYNEAGIKMSEFKHSKSHPYLVNLEDTRKLCEEMCTLPRKQREKYFPSHPDFTDGASTGLASLLAIADHLGLMYELPSNISIMDGVIDLVATNKWDEFLKNE